MWKIKFTHTLYKCSFSFRSSIFEWFIYLCCYYARQRIHSFIHFILQTFKQQRAENWVILFYFFFYLPFSLVQIDDFFLSLSNFAMIFFKAIPLNRLLYFFGTMFFFFYLVIWISKSSTSFFLLFFVVFNFNFQQSVRQKKMLPIRLLRFLKSIHFYVSLCVYVYIFMCMCTYTNTHVYYFLWARV